MSYPAAKGGTMPKRNSLLVLLFLVIALFTGCNRTVIGPSFHFQQAIIKLPDGTVVKGQVEKWHDYAYKDQVQVQIDGVVYLVHSTDCVLLKHLQ